MLREPSLIRNCRGAASRASLLHVSAVFMLLIVGAALLLSPSPLDLLFRIIAIGGVVLMLFSVAIVLLTYHKVKTVSPPALLVSLLMSLTCFSVYLIILNFQLSVAYWVVALFLGVGVGIALMTTNRLYIDQGAIKSRANVWYLAIWGTMFATTQLVVIISGRTPAISLVLLLFGTGVVVGNVSSLLVRYYRTQNV